MNKLRTLSNGNVIFWCPGCDHPHSINVKTDTRPRWVWNGDMVEPTFSPSILVTTRWSQNEPDMKDDVCHSFVRDGMIEFLGDCTHKLKGQTVPIADWPYDTGEYGGVID